MNYRHLSLLCHCGEVPDRIAEVGFTDDHQLVIHWWCSNCQRVVYVTKPLTDCWRECPPPDLSLDNALPKAEAPKSKSNWDAYQDEDAQFLRSIGVQV